MTTFNRRAILAMGALAPASIEAASAPGSASNRALFGDIGIFLNGAALHPLPKRSADAGMAALKRQVDRHAPQPVPPTKTAIAHLLNVQEDELAFVPSTGYAENMVATAVGLGPDAGVVTDTLHYESALAMYAERARRGMPLTVVRAKDGVICLDDIAAAITPKTKLVALSAISNFNGFRHDLRAVCDIAHAHGAVVFADVIQAVGAVPLDIPASGVDFCAASTYKWMMGDLGFGFLFARKQAQARISRPLVGWAEISDSMIVDQTTLYDRPVSVNSWTFQNGARGLFEVGQPSKIASSTVAASLGLIEELGLHSIASHRDTLRKQARDMLLRLPKVIPLTPQDTSTTIESFAIHGAEVRFAAAFKAKGISAGLYANRLRLSPSIYNSESDIEILADIVKRN